MCVCVCWGGGRDAVREARSLKDTCTKREPPTADLQMEVRFRKTSVQRAVQHQAADVGK